MYGKVKQNKTSRARNELQTISASERVPHNRHSIIKKKKQNTNFPTCLKRILFRWINSAGSRMKGGLKGQHERPPEHTNIQHTHTHTQRQTSECEREISYSNDQPINNSKLVVRV